jgi:opacity protein-like surface antigen
VLGSLQNGWFGLVGLRYHRLLIPAQQRSLATHDAATLTYTADLIPLAQVAIPEGTPPMARSLRTRSVTERGLRTWGLGVYPLGLRVGFRPSTVARPFISGHTGLFYLFDAMPDERGRHLNFAVGVGVGLELEITRRTTVTLGYRYHHLSNGFRGRINPGFDANLLYVGIGAAP